MGVLRTLVPSSESSSWRWASCPQPWRLLRASSKLTSSSKGRGAFSDSFHSSDAKVTYITTTSKQMDKGIGGARVLALGQRRRWLVGLRPVLSQPSACADGGRGCAVRTAFRVLHAGVVLLQRGVWWTSSLGGHTSTTTLAQPTPSGGQKPAKSSTIMFTVAVGFFAACCLHVVQVLFRRRHRFWLCKARPPSTGFHQLLCSDVTFLPHCWLSEMSSLEGVGSPLLPQLKVARPFRIGVSQVPSNLGRQPSFSRPLTRSSSSFLRICNLSITLFKGVHVPLLYLN
ncbi:hypothetical protein PVAP13_8KG230903 [Panicum virgatum]|uniref:Uncharacterized protein n=1 Tax=Panicum virgatum TaxID=38727 RepID=A0A8T0PU08_PANVG|nr:hypothetical protein PVAP13_8KG230903 [Panicum virgatum]